MPYDAMQVASALRAAGIDATPDTLGLAAYANDPVAYATHLARLHPTRGHRCGGYANCCTCSDCLVRAEAMQSAVRAVVPFTDGEPCAVDPMLCGCAAHRAERAMAVRQGRRDVSQPWQARPANWTG